MTEEQYAKLRILKHLQNRMVVARQTAPDLLAIVQSEIERIERKVVPTIQTSRNELERLDVRVEG